MSGATRTRVPRQDNVSPVLEDDGSRAPITEDATGLIAWETLRSDRRSSSRTSASWPVWSPSPGGWRSLFYPSSRSVRLIAIAGDSRSCRTSRRRSDRGSALFRESCGGNRDRSRSLFQTIMCSGPSVNRGAEVVLDLGKSVTKNRDHDARLLPHQLIAACAGCTDLSRRGGPRAISMLRSTLARRLSLSFLRRGAGVYFRENARSQNAPRRDCEIVRPRHGRRSLRASGR